MVLLVGSMGIYYIGIIWELYREYIGIMGKKMEMTMETATL